ncbi:hypothetical protein D3C79_546530 [compost metagenome]
MVARRFVVGGLGIVEQARCVQAQVEGAFYISLLCQQHSFHIGVRDDRYCRAERVFAVRQPALRPLASVFQGVKVAGVTQHHRAHAYAYPRLVHHLEHAGQALVRLADQIADALAIVAEVQGCGGGAAPAHLVEQPGQQHIVARATAAVRVYVVLGHDEQRDAFDPGRGVRKLGQHHVHDVFRQFVVAAGNEDLVAFEPVAAVACWFGAGTDVGQRRAGVGFGQRHGAEVAALDHRLQEQALLLFSAEALDQVGRAHGQEWVGRGASVGGLEVGEAGLRDQAGQLHAAHFEIAVGVEETGFEEGVDGGLHFGDQLRAAVHVAWLVFVGLAVVRGEILFGDGAGGGQCRIEGFTAVLGEARALGQGFGVEDFVELEGEVAGAEQGLGHGGGPEAGCCECRSVVRLGTG